MLKLIKSKYGVLFINISIGRLKYNKSINTYTYTWSINVII